MKRKDRQLAILNEFIEEFIPQSVRHGEMMIKSIASLRIDSDGFQLVDFNIKDFEQNRGRIEKFIDSLSDLRIVNKSNRIIKNISLFDQVEHHIGSGIVSAKLSEAMRRHVLQLNSNFTQISETESLEANRKGGNTLKLFWLLKQQMRYDNTSWEVSVAELRELTHTTDKYLAFRDFDKRILKPISEQMQDYGLLIEKKKVGRAIGRIVFAWEAKKRSSKGLPQPVQGNVIVQTIEANAALIQRHLGYRQKHGLMVERLNQTETPVEPGTLAMWIARLIRAGVSKPMISKIMKLDCNLTMRLRSIYPITKGEYDKLDSPSAYIIAKLQEYYPSLKKT